MRSVVHLASPARLLGLAFLTVAGLLAYVAPVKASCQNPCGPSACASQIGCVSVGTTFCTHSGQLMRCDYVWECPSLAYIGPCGG